MKKVQWSLGIILLATGIGLFFSQADRLAQIFNGNRDPAGVTGSLAENSPQGLQAESETESSPFDLTRQRTKPPEGLLVEGKPNLVRSPYSPDKGFMDIDGIPPGTAIRCPWSGKAFTVPGPSEVEEAQEVLVDASEPAPRSDDGEGEESEPNEGPVLHTQRYSVSKDSFKDETLSAKDVLEAHGIEFAEEGSTAFYISTQSQLVIRNTEAQLALIDELVSSVGGKPISNQAKSP